MIGDFFADRAAAASRRRGNLARDRRDWAEAGTAYRRYLGRRPDDFAIWVQLGHVLSEVQDYVRADEAYAQASRLSANDADLLLCWGHSRRMAGDPDRAQELYTQSFAADGNAAARAELDAAAPDRPVPAPAPAPEADHDEAVRVGRIERVEGLTICGRLVGAASDDAVEFRYHGTPFAQAALDPALAAGGWSSFKITLDLAHDVQLSAHRLSDGAELDNSPFYIGPRRDYRESERAPWDARCDIVKPFEPKPGTEIALFVTHSGSGALKPHILPYLQALRGEGIAVLLIAVTDRTLNIRPEVLDAVDGAMIRENAGYDFAALAHAIRLFPEAYGASILYVINDSLILSADRSRFANMLARVRASAADLVGLTESHEYRWHLQSYFLALKPRLLASFTLQRFFREIRELGDKHQVIQSYELRFAEEVERSGHKIEILFPSRAAMNPTLGDWRALIADGFPLMKLLLLRGAFPDHDIAGWRDTLAEAAFDIDLIDATVRASRERVPRDGDDRLFAHPLPLDTAENRPLKVAFYGPWNYDNGLGFASRGIIGALRRSGVRLNLHPVRKPFHVHKPLGPAVDIADFAGPADIAIVHLNPDSWFLLTDEQRRAIAQARKRIGYWVWEMGHIPPAWRHDFSSVDRIWAPSAYCAELFARQDEAPVDIIPHPVALPPPAGGDRGGELAALDLPADARLILYIFDGSSYLVRKNPAALVRAFAASKLGEQGWTLVLKTKHLMDRADEGAALRDLTASVPHVLLIDRPMAPAALHDLMALADIYASPHCSEGFGLTIAEAMAAGKAVVATDFGGSADFLDATTGYPVKARPWQLSEDHGHYTKGGEWARVDEPALTAALLRAAGDVMSGNAQLAAAGRARIADRLSPDRVAGLIAASLRDTMTGRGASPRIERLTLDLDRGATIEDGPGGHDIALRTLEPDGSPRPEGLATDGDRWIAFAPEGSVLAPDFADIIAQYARDRPDVAIFYADDVAAEVDETIDRLRLKPEFDVTLLAAQDYVGAPLIVRASAFAALNGFRGEYGTAAVADLLFRADAAGLSIARIPHVLLAHPAGRVRASGDDYRAMVAAQPMLADLRMEAGRAPHTFALVRDFSAGAAPMVTILIPTRRSALPDGRGTYLERLLDGIAQADWPMEKLTVIVGDDVVGEPDWAVRDWPFALERIETPRAPGEPFNYAAKMNRLWRAARSEQILFLNDDIRMTDARWMKALQTFAVDPGVGGVGARLLFEDGTLQHAGMGAHGDGAAHAWIYRRRIEGTYQGWALAQREWSMVTGAVFATRRSLMEALDGFDERFALEFNDTDLCLRMRTLDLRIVCNPLAEMVHTEKASRGQHLPPGNDLALFLSRWKAWIDQDPSWHPQLRRDRLDLTPSPEDDAWYL